jgi:L-aspartate oxidase
MRTVRPTGAEVIGGRDLPLPPPPDPATAAGATTEQLRDRLQRAMTRGAGVLRDEDSLAATRDEVARVEARAWAGDAVTAEDWELRNLAAAARGLLAAATAREESRGAHTRQDFPAEDPDLRLRLIVS